MKPFEMGTDEASKGLPEVNIVAGAGDAGLGIVEGYPIAGDAELALATGIDAIV